MLGLCLGAGASADFDFPSWPKLLERIAKHKEIQGEGLLRVSESLTSQAQFLFQMYRQRIKATNLESGDEVADARQAQTGWMRIVHECLYEGVRTEEKDLRSHPYLWTLVPLIKQSSMTVNYNFDDTVERMLYLRYADAIRAADDRGFEVVWRPAIQFRRKQGVVYHPNGFLPFNTSDGMSDQIVFMDEEFADQLIEAGMGHYACLLNHFTKQTLIFIGLSMNDTTLKHLLRVAARANPGHFHYHIHWCDQGAKPSPEEQAAITDANFALYNLVTFFLTTQEIETFVGLITEDDEAFNAHCDEELEGVRTEYRYYVTGAVGAGKTTVVEQIRSIECFEEWVDRKHHLLHRAHQELEAAQRRDVDAWINQQFRKKNRRVSQAQATIALVDRSPLDPLYFAENQSAERTRAAELHRAMVPPNGPIKRIAPGHVILLKCDVSVLRTRLAAREKRYTSKHVLSHQETIDNFWNARSEVTRIDTTNMTVARVIKRILGTILFEPYQEIDFDELCRLKGALTP
jgi:broad-specificity NMP kinase